jgi:hypothetical protein
MNFSARVRSSESNDINKQQRNIVILHFVQDDDVKSKRPQETFRVRF